MSEFILNETTGKITDVTLFYTFLQKAQSSEKYPEPKWSVSFAVDKKTAKAFKKAFPKNGCQEFDNDEFQEKFGVLPYPDQDEQFMLKLAVKSKLKGDIPKMGVRAGDEMPYSFIARPKVYVPEGEGKVKDVTMDVSIANGSKGDIAFNLYKTEMGTFPQLRGVLVTDLIEYESKGGGFDNPFGEVVNEPTQPTVSHTEHTPDGGDDIDENVPF